MTVWEAPVMSSRARRSDVGPRLTPRDAAALTWLAEQYGAPLDLVALLLGTTRTRTYEVVRRWRTAGWIKTGTPVPGPTWVAPTQATARQFLDRERLGDWSPNPTTAAHTRAVAAVRLWMGFGPGVPGWTSERLLRSETGYREQGQRVGHLADAVFILAATEQRAETEVLVEVELTPKGAQRTRQTVSEVIAQSTRRTGANSGSGRNPGVLYVTTRAAVAEVQAAANGSEAGRRVRVESIEEVPLALEAQW